MKTILWNPKKHEPAIKIWTNKNFPLQNAKIWHTQKFEKKNPKSSIERDHFDSNIKYKNDIAR